MNFKSLASYLVPVCLGILLFWLIPGFKFLDPRNLDAFHYSDNFQHHLSSVFFRNSSWTFPIGLNPNYGLINSSTIVYSDSIPLMAVLFKAAKSFIPNHFQYLGLWTLISLVMQSIFAWKLMGILTPKIMLKTLGTGFFLFTPVLLLRIGLHAALVAQFLLLAALYLSFSVRKSTSPIYWILLVVISASIHFYLFFLIFIIWIANLLDSYFCKRDLKIKVAILEFFMGIASIAIVLWQLGYFVGATSSIAAGGFGFYQMNVLAPLDPQGWSYLYKKLTPSQPTIEGLVYFGFGIFFLVPFAFLKNSAAKDLITQKIIQHVFLMCSLFFFLFLALSNRVLIGKFVFEYPLPEALLVLGGIVRSSGRMFWPITYLFILLLLALIIKKFNAKKAQWILAVGLAIQIVDTSAGWGLIRVNLHHTSSLGKETQFNHPFWKSAASHYKNVISLIPQKMYDESWSWIPAAKYSAENNLGTNSAYLSRVVPLENRPINNAMNELDFNIGKYDTKSLYILSEQKLLPAIANMNPQLDVLAKIDGIIAFAPGYKKCVDCFPLTKELDIYAPIMPMLINNVFSFGRSSSYAYLPYLLEGWAYPESWGTWSNGKKAAIALPLPKNGNPQSLELAVRAFVTSNHLQQRIRIWINGTSLKTIALHKNINIIDIPISQDVKKEGYLIIGLNFYDPMAPHTLGLGDDTRTLSIGLISGKYK